MIGTGQGTVLERVTEVFEEVCSLAETVRGSTVAHESVVSVLTMLIRTRNAIDAVTTAMLAEADRLGSARRAGMRLREVLSRAGCAPAVASRLITVGRDGSVLPAIARLGVDGAVSLDHAHAIVTGIRHVSSRTHSRLDSPLVVDSQRTLIGCVLAGFTPTEITARARALTLAHTDTEVGDGEPAVDVPVAEDSTLNDVGWGIGDDGRLHGRFDLDVVTGEALVSVLDRAARPRPEPDGTPDPRSVGRRRADAVADLLGAHARAPVGPDFTGGPRTDVSLTIDLTDPAGPRSTGPEPSGADTAPARLAWLGPIGVHSARLLTCDASLTRIGVDRAGAPVEVGATRRLFTGPVRRAIIARDRCCIKCGAPASWTDVHHIVHYVDGGPTTVDNGCLLCRSCHTAVHHQGWDIGMGRDRHPYLVPPATVDPYRTAHPAYSRRTLRLDASA